MKRGLLYGAAGGALLVLLKVIEYQYVVRLAGRGLRRARRAPVHRSQKLRRNFLQFVSSDFLNGRTSHIDGCTRCGGTSSTFSRSPGASRASTSAVRT
jgi:hypothetical protein